MVFEIKNKIALVTGGAAGIGLCHVNELLKHGVKGIVIADVNDQVGEKVCNELQQEYGKGRIVFVKTDVSNSDSFENAFKVTLQHFNNIDILINNAGVCKDYLWEREIDINLKGNINGIVLGLDKYLRNYKQGEEAVIVNTSSVSALEPVPVMPIYAATKSAIFWLTKCYGVPFHYERTKVRVVSICPGLTSTHILDDANNCTLNPEYAVIMDKTIADLSKTLQKPEEVSTEAIEVIKKAPNGSLWVIEGGQPAYEFIPSSRKEFINNTFK